MSARTEYSAEGFVVNDDGTLKGWCDECSLEVDFVDDAFSASCPDCGEGNSLIRPFFPTEE